MLDSKLREDLISSPSPVAANDLQSVNAIVKHIHRIYFEAGYALSQAAVQNSNDPNARDQLLDMAKSLFQESLRVKPNDFRSLHNLGYSLFLQATSSQLVLLRLIEQAIDMFKQASILEPKDYKSIYTWAQCLVELGKHSPDDNKVRLELFDEALAKYEKAFTLAKQARKDIKSKIQFLWGSAYLARADMQLQPKGDSLARSTTSIAPPDDDVVMANMGTSSSSPRPPLGSQDVEDALSHFEAAVRLGSAEADTFHNYAVALSKRARLHDVVGTQKGNSLYEQAFEQFKKASTLRPHSYEIHFNWGNALVRFARAAISTLKKSKVGKRDDVLQGYKKLRAMLNSAAGCYNSTVSKRPTYNAAFTNWARVVRQMSELEAWFRGVLPQLPPDEFKRNQGGTKKSKRGRSRISTRSAKRRKVADPEEDAMETDAFSVDESSGSADEDDVENAERRASTLVAAGKELLKRVRENLLKEPTLVKPTPLFELAQLECMAPYVLRALEDICQITEKMATPPAQLIQECRLNIKLVKTTMRKKSMPRISSSDSLLDSSLSKFSVTPTDEMQVDPLVDTAGPTLLDHISDALKNFDARDIVADSVWEITDGAESSSGNRFALKAIPGSSLRLNCLHLLLRGRKNIFTRGSSETEASLMTGSQLASLQDEGADTEDEDEEKLYRATQTEDEQKVKQVRCSAAKDQFLVPIVGYFAEPEHNLTSVWPQICPTTSHDPEHTFPSLRFVGTSWVPSGMTLKTLVSTYGALSADLARFIAAEVLLAIERLHALHVTALLLRPENILLDQDGHVRVLPPIKFCGGIDHEAYASLLGTLELCYSNRILLP